MTRPCAARPAVVAAAGAATTRRPRPRAGGPTTPRATWRDESHRRRPRRLPAIRTKARAGRPRSTRRANRLEPGATARRMIASSRPGPRPRAGGAAPGRSSRRAVAHPFPRPRTNSSPASGSSYSRGSTNRTATTSCRSVRRSSGRSQPGLADEVGDQHEQRPAAHDPRRRVRAVRRGRSTAPPSDRAEELARAGASTWWRPCAGGIVDDLVAVVDDGADPVAATHEQLAEDRRQLGAARAPWSVSAAPNAIDRERSSRSHAVSSRSSMNSRTNSSSMRAVTFQSMWRTSSPHS